MAMHWVEEGVDDAFEAAAVDGLAAGGTHLVSSVGVRCKGCVGFT
jgi:hypothetical protein